MGLVHDKHFQEAKGKADGNVSMEQGELLPSCVQLCRAQGWGVPRDPGDKPGEGGISKRSEDTSQHRRDSPGRQSLSQCCIQLLQPHPGNLWQLLQRWERERTEPTRTTGHH